MMHKEKKDKIKASGIHKCINCQSFDRWLYGSLSNNETFDDIS